MSLIEGVGDEVTVLLALIVIAVVVVVGWLSTGVHTMPVSSIVIVERGRFNDFVNRLRALGSSSVRRLSSAASGTGGGAPASQSVDRSSDTTDNAAVDGSPTDSGEQDVVSGASEPQSRGVAAAESRADAQPDSAPGDDGPQPMTSSLPSDSITSQNDAEVQDGDMGSSSADGQVTIKLQYVDGRHKTVHARPSDTIGRLKQ